MTTPLRGKRIAPYYGCQIVRPDAGAEAHGAPAVAQDTEEAPRSAMAFGVSVEP